MKRKRRRKNPRLNPAAFDDPALRAAWRDATKILGHAPRVGGRRA